MKENRLQVIKILIMALNITAVLFYVAFIFVTVNFICDRNSARVFLEKVNSIPSNPLRLVMTIMVLLGCFILSFYCREYLFPRYGKLGLITLILDLIISIAIVYLLNFNYNGILLLVSANIIANTRKKQRKYILMVLTIGIFLIADYALVNIYFNLFQIMDYINFYNSSTQKYLLVIFNLFNSLNLIMFIIYCVYVIQEQSETIEEVNSLYQKLSFTNNELLDANIRLQDYALITEKAGQTKERNRLAREIHDSLGHTLTGISAAVDACITTVEKSPQETKMRLETIAEITRQGIIDVRRSVSELRPDSLENLNLEYAITKMINNINTITNTKVYFYCTIDELNFDKDEEETIYRVVQESITNAIKHGKASKIWVKIYREANDVTVTIEDNGVGAENITSGFGTSHMAERVKMLNGTISFGGTDGFVVKAKIPIRWGESGLS